MAVVLLFNTAEDYAQTPIAALQVVRRPLGPAAT
jgi:hypothetical protein